MDLAALQTRIGYQFKDENLLIQSLTHPSFRVRAAEEEITNQRMEFLGDAVLELIITEFLYRKYPQHREGRLTQSRSTLVKGTVLVELAGWLALSECIRVNNSGTNTSPNELPSSQEDALEALVGAIYLDSDLPATNEVVLRWYGDLTERLNELKDAHNPKGQLQELLQPTMGNNQIRYEVTEESGPSHARRFEVELFIGDQSCSKGTGRSKKEAEECAAREVLKDFESFDFPHA